MRGSTPGRICCFARSNSRARRPSSPPFFGGAERKKSIFAAALTQGGRIVDGAVAPTSDCACAVTIGKRLQLEPTHGPEGTRHSPFHCLEIFEQIQKKLAIAELNQLKRFVCHRPPSIAKRAMKNAFRHSGKSFCSQHQERQFNLVF